MTTQTMQPAHDPAYDPRDDLPWWNIESPIRRRIKGTYLRRISFVVALVILGMHLLPYVPR